MQNTNICQNTRQEPQYQHDALAGEYPNPFPKRQNNGACPSKRHVYRFHAFDRNQLAPHTNHVRLYP